MIEINPKSLNGKRANGYALDIQTLNSKLTGSDEFGHPTFETERSPIGEALFQLKYRAEKSNAGKIAETVSYFIQNDWPDLDKIDFIVPVPPSKLTRPFQPVEEIARIVADTIGVKLSSGDLVKRTKTPELKNIADEDERFSILSEAFEIGSSILEGKHVLLFDDLLGSGATLRAIVDILYDKAKVRLVSVLVLTYKRTRQ
jgi:predicted amidophosphoribosyltransferase